MVEHPRICRICLAMNVRLLPIAGTPLQGVFERLTTNSLLTADNRPLSACYICHSLLRKSHKLMMKSATAEDLLTAILEKKSKITKRSMSLVNRKVEILRAPLVISKPECIEIVTHGSEPVKTEPITIKTERDEPVLPNVEPMLKNVEPMLLNVEPMLTNVEPVFSHAKPLLQNVDLLLGNVEQARTVVEPRLVAVEPPLEVKTEFEAEDSYLLPDGETSHCNNNYEEQNETNYSVNSINKMPQDPLEVVYDDPVISAQNPEQLQTGESQQKQRLNTPKPAHIQIYQCTICQRQFKHKNTLKVHLRSHNGEKPFECDICQLKCTTSGNLQVHKRTHTSHKPYQCNVCQQQFQRKDHLNCHSLTHR